MLKHLVIAAKGVVVGIANVIPGVSGGTMAFILGIYEELTESIGNFFTNREKRKEYLVFLIVIAIGAAAGILLFARVVTILMEHARVATYFLFLGLIAGSVPAIIKFHSDMQARPGRIMLFAAGVILVVLATLLGPGAHTAGKATTSLPAAAAPTGVNIGYGLWLALCGFLAAGSMIVPGFSGSALLVSLGEYRNILAFVDQRMLVPVACVGIGAVLGILVFAKVIDFCLKRFPAATFYFILGLVAGSFFQVFNTISGDLNMSALWWLISCAAFAAGFVGAFLLGKINSPATH